MRWPFDTQQARAPRNRITIPGWAPPPLRKSVADLERRLAATQLRVDQASLVNVPGAIKGEKIFSPDLGNTRTVSAQTVNDTVLSGSTYDIEVPYNSPGVFVARSLVVSTSFRDYNVGPPAYVMWWPLIPGGSGTFSVNTNSKGSVARNLMYFWNLEDPRSGKRFGDDLMSCMALLPPSSTIPGSRLMFDTPWLLERDSQLRFMFRPIVDIVQTANSSVEDGAPRNQAVRVRVELHGTRYFTEQDVMRKGAIVP